MIIISDDMDYSALGPMGYVDTPHIDSIIEGGTHFSNGYVSAPVCAPARAGLMTGRHQRRIDLAGWNTAIEEQIANDVGVDTREILLPQYMKDAGYATGVIGKWHLGYNEKFLTGPGGPSRSLISPL